MHVDIYQRDGASPANSTDPAPGSQHGPRHRRRGDPAPRTHGADPETTRTPSLVGEDHTGRLQVVERPSGNYGSFVEQTVTAENGDRDTLMRAEAARRRVPLATVESERAEQWRERAFAGEWIEMRQADGTWKVARRRARRPAAARLPDTPSHAAP